MVIYRLKYSIPIEKPYLRSEETKYFENAEAANRVFDEIALNPPSSVPLHILLDRLEIAIVEGQYVKKSEKNLRYIFQSLDLPPNRDPAYGSK